MTHLGYVILCLTVPVFLSLFFLGRKERKGFLFFIIGMFSALLSAYVNSFFMAVLGADTVTAAVEIAPVCEELLKFFPLLVYYVIFEPEREDLSTSAVALSVGFATYENVCWLAEHGTADLTLLLVRGFSTGALHILCGISLGFCLSYIFRHRWLRAAGTAGIIGACVCIHGIFNLLIAWPGWWQIIGYAFPSCIVVLFFLMNRFLPDFPESFN